jgi:hypothetical protein
MDSRNHKSTDQGQVAVLAGVAAAGLLRSPPPPVYS